MWFKTFKYLCAVLFICIAVSKSIFLPWEGTGISGGHFAVVATHESPHNGPRYQDKNILRLSPLSMTLLCFLGLFFIKCIVQNMTKNRNWSYASFFHIAIRTSCKDLDHTSSYFTHVLCNKKTMECP